MRVWACFRVFRRPLLAISSLLIVFFVVGPFAVAKVHDTEADYLVRVALLRVGDVEGVRMVSSSLRRRLLPRGDRLIARKIAQAQFGAAPAAPPPARTAQFFRRRARRIAGTPSLRMRWRWRGADPGGVGDVDHVLRLIGVCHLCGPSALFKGSGGGFWSHELWLWLLLSHWLAELPPVLGVLLGHMKSPRGARNGPTPPPPRPCCSVAPRRRRRLPDSAWPLPEPGGGAFERCGLVRGRLTSLSGLPVAHRRPPGVRVSPRGRSTAAPRRRPSDSPSPSAAMARRRRRCGGSLRRTNASSTMRCTCTAARRA